MTEAELVAYLADLIARGQITDAEAAELLARFETGNAPELAQRPPDPQPDGDDWLAALLFVLMLANADAPLTDAARVRVRNTLRPTFGANVTRLAGQLAQGSIGVGQWERNMQNALIAYTLRMAMAGAGTMPSRATQEQVAATLPAQRVFLDRYTVQLAARQPGIRPMTQAAIASRAELYGGVAWAAFHIAQADGLGPGWTEQWVARDDGDTCGPCSELSGRFFLPGVGPMPGSICLGRGRCRCERVPVFDMETWEQLQEARAA